METADPGRTQPIGSGRLVIVALSLAMVAVILTNVYIGRIKEQVEVKSFVVYKLNRSVKAGEKLKRSDLDEELVPEKFEETFRDRVKPRELDTRLREGKKLRQAAQRGDFLTHELYQDRQNKDVDQKIGLGYRLMALPVNSKTVPGSIAPGMFVDIAAPFSTGGSLPEVLTVMENIQIIAIGTRSVVDVEAGSRARPTRSFHAISIQVRPEHAIMLSNVARLAIGDFEILLRNPAEDDMPVTSRAGGINKRVVKLVEEALNRPPPPR